MNQKNGRKHARGASILLAPSSNSAVSAAAQMSLLDATKSTKDDKPLLLQQHPLNLNAALNAKETDVGLALFASNSNNGSKEGQNQQFSVSDHQKTANRSSSTTAASGLVETVDMMEKYLHTM
jgi:hypothetical protein